MEGIVGGADPSCLCPTRCATGDFDEIVVSTLSKKTSKWLRRDLVRKIEGLGLPVTTVTAAGDRAGSHRQEGVRNVGWSGGRLP